MEITREHENSAKAESELWLTCIDDGDFSKAYCSASSFLKSQLSKSEFEASVVGARENKITQGVRKYLGFKHFTSLSDAPPGDYLVMQYQHTLAGGGNRIETITPVFEDGKWSVCGYYVRNS